MNIYCNASMMVTQAPLCIEADCKLCCDLFCFILFKEISDYILQQIVNSVLQTMYTFKKILNPKNFEPSYVSRRVCLFIQYVPIPVRHNEAGSAQLTEVLR